MNREQKAAAFDLFCGQLEAQIEADTQDYLADNPYTTDEDCDYNGRKFNRPERETTEEEALDAVIRKYLNNAEDAGAYDFYEFVFWYLYGDPMGSRNPFQALAKPESTANPIDEAIQALKDLPAKLAKAGQK